jgi:hypothetical protein
MYLDNKYTRAYYALVEKARSRNFKNKKEALSILGYVESHHIIPKSIGGNNLKTNLVYLTAREHFICHLLLTKMTEGKNKSKMIHAAASIGLWKNKKRRVKINSRTAESLRIQRINTLKEENAKPENKKKSSDGAKKLWNKDGYREEASARRKKLWDDPEFQKRMESRVRPHKRVSINGIIYDSLKEASIQLNIGPTVVSKRCSSKKEQFNDWIVLEMYTK